MNLGYLTTVDDADADFATAVKWFANPSKNNRVYVSRKQDGKAVYLHRLIMERVLGEPLGKRVVDHIDGNPLNNVRANLRAVTQVENLRNSVRVTGASGVRGVVWHNQREKWWARITVGGKLKSLGLFDAIEDAQSARLKAERDLWGVHPRRASEHS